MDSATGSKSAVYFAYGTLLDINHMRSFCPSAQPTGIMRLAGYRLGFSTCAADPSVGGCTLKEAPGHILYGVLYALQAKELEDLDKASGLDRGLWATKHITVTDAQGKAIRANTYIIENVHGDYIPPASYTRPILEGLQMWGFPPHYVDEVKNSISGTGPSEFV